jgi:hypothetical protein
MSCSCRQRCESLFTREELATLIDSIRSLSRRRKKEVILDCIFATYCARDMPSEAKRRRLMGEVAQRSVVQYILCGRKVCKVFFASCFSVSVRVLDNYVSLMGKMGTRVPVIHDKRGGQREVCPGKKAKAKKMLIAQHILKFARDKGLLSPSGRSWGAEGSDVIIHLPSDIKTKEDLYDAITKSAKIDLRVSYSYFLRVWKSCVPYVQFQPSGTDYCNECARLLRDRPPGFEKELCAHREEANLERLFYKESLLEARKLYDADESCLHVSFDFAQAVRLPHEKLQPQKAYYTSGLKVDMFGIVCETIAEHCIYLINEAEHPGKYCKGSMHVISFIDNFIASMSPKVSTLLLHADNCVAQNKNKYVLSYFYMMVLLGRFQYVRLMFMLPGHTKFSVDGIFGVVKKRYFRENSVFTPAEFEKVVLDSSKFIRVRRLDEHGWKDWRKILTNLGSRIRSKHLGEFQIFEFVQDDEHGVKMHVYRSSTDFKKRQSMCWYPWPSGISKDEMKHRLDMLLHVHTMSPDLLTKKRVRQLTKIMNGLVSVLKRVEWRSYILGHSSPSVSGGSRECVAGMEESIIIGIDCTNQEETSERDVENGEESDGDSSDDSQESSSSDDETAPECSKEYRRFVDKEKNRIEHELDTKWQTKCVQVQPGTFRDQIVKCCFCGECLDTSTLDEEEKEISCTWWKCLNCDAVYCELCSDHELNDDTGLCSSCDNPELLFLGSLRAQPFHQSRRS